VRERDLVLSDTQNNFYPSVYTEILLPILCCTSFSHTHFLKWLYTHTYTHTHTQNNFYPSMYTEMLLPILHCTPFSHAHFLKWLHIHTHTHTHTQSLSPQTRRTTSTHLTMHLSLTHPLSLSLSHTPDTQNDFCPSYNAPATCLPPWHALANFFKSQLFSHNA